MKKEDAVLEESSLVGLQGFGRPYVKGIFRISVYIHIGGFKLQPSATLLDAGWKICPLTSLALWADTEINTTLSWKESLLTSYKELEVNRDIFENVETRPNYYQIGPKTKVSKHLSSKVTWKLKKNSVYRNCTIYKNL